MTQAWRGVRAAAAQMTREIGGGGAATAAGRGMRPLVLRHASLMGHDCPLQQFRFISFKFGSSGGRSRSSGNLASQIAKTPKMQPDTPWRRLAELLKESDGQEAEESIYMQRLKSHHHPGDHLEKLEEEMREEMAGALGRTASKCDYHFLLLERQKRKLSRVMEKARGGGGGGGGGTIGAAVVATATTGAGNVREMRKGEREGEEEEGQEGTEEEEGKEYNRLRLAAEECRKQLMIHRQAMGFRTGNHQMVEKKWPLPPPWPFHPSPSSSSPSSPLVGENREGAGGGKTKQENGAHNTAQEIQASQAKWREDMERMNRSRR